MRKAMFVTWALLCMGSMVYARDFKVAVKDLPGRDDFAAIVTAIVKATGNSTTIQFFPPARADYMVAHGQVDLQYPIVAPADASKQKGFGYDFASVVLFKVAWVLYTNKDKPIDVASLRNGNPKGYRIEVDPSQTDNYNFTTSPSNNFEASFTKLAKGSIDGFILFQAGADDILKKAGYKNIKRDFWEDMDNTVSLPKGGRGGEVDKLLTEGLAKMKTNGDYDRLIAPMAKAMQFIDWQP